MQYNVPGKLGARGTHTMRTYDVSDPTEFVAMLCKLRARSRKKVKRLRINRIPRSGLSSTNRQKVLEKTKRHCHICGGDLVGDDWVADHVLHHARGGPGGAQSLDNYLPAHSLCNSYRRCSDEEFPWVLKLGVWLRTQIANETEIGREAVEKFCRHQRSLSKRGKPRKI